MYFFCIRGCTYATSGPEKTLKYTKYFTAKFIFCYIYVPKINVLQCFSFMEKMYFSVFSRSRHLILYNIIICCEKFPKMCFIFQETYDKLHMLYSLGKVNYIFDDFDVQILVYFTTSCI